MSEAQIQFTHISKTFFGIKALHDITFSIPRGQIIGLIGQNGAGKSTLMNILGGVVQPDAGGQMTIQGKAYHPRTPAHATEAGIAFIHQELNLFTNLSIAENIFIDKFPKQRFGFLEFVDYPHIYRETQAVLSSMGLKLSPKALIDDLSPGERQLVEIAKAIHLDAEVIIFDEPTTSLTARETEQLFSLIRQLREQGKTMIYISHILGDVLNLVDEIAVLRDGQLMAVGHSTDFDINRMISLMIGRDLEQFFPDRTSQPSQDTVLEVKGLSQQGIAKDIHLRLYQGEVLGIFGLMGSGRTELARMIFGLDEYSQGEIYLQNKPLPPQRPQLAIQAGMAFVTENRREEGLMLESTIAENIALASLGQWASTPIRLIDPQELTLGTERMAETLHIKSGEISRHKAKTLSGGNQQKVVIAKWLLSNPAVFILDEPTRGIDVGAKFEIYSIIDQLATQGSGLIFISSELDELIGMCDRILVMGRGEICGEFVGPHYEKTQILAAAFQEGVSS